MTFCLKSIVKAIPVFALVLFSNSLSAAMIVEQSIVHFQPGDAARKDVKIINPDPEPLYIQVEIREITNAGKSDEKVTLISNPKDAGFLVTPNRMAIQPGSQQMVRLVNLKSLGEKERVFRIALKPVAADVEAEQTGVKVLIGYELLILIQPIMPKLKITAIREGSKLTLINEGNVNGLMNKGLQCKDGKNSGCEDLPSFRLYPGNQRTIDLKYTTPVSYIITSGTSNQAVEY